MAFSPHRLLLRALPVVVMATACVAASSAPASAATSNTWSTAANNVQAPGYQTATVLADGRVLAVGGQGTKAELFNPTTGAWSVAAN